MGRMSSFLQAVRLYVHTVCYLGILTIHLDTKLSLALATQDVKAIVVERGGESMVLLTRSLGHRTRYEAPWPLSGGRNYRDISDASMFATSRGCLV
jgi:hypothetical protein